MEPSDALYSFRHSLYECLHHRADALFELTDAKKTYRGSAELQQTTDSDGRSSTRVWVKIVDRPSYMEEAILDRLETKLRDELGDPLPPPEPPAPPPPAADDKGDKKDKKE